MKRIMEITNDLPEQEQVIAVIEFETGSELEFMARLVSTLRAFPTYSIKIIPVKE